MAIDTPLRRRNALDRWDLANYAEPGVRIAAAVVYDVEQDAFLLLNSTAHPAPQRGEPTGGEKLSPRELQILQLVAAGLDNKELADKLRISLSTVKVHLQSIFQRLRVSTRNQAVARAFDDGWMAFSRPVGYEADKESCRRWRNTAI